MDRQTDQSETLKVSSLLWADWHPPRYLEKTKSRVRECSRSKAERSNCRLCRQQLAPEAAAVNSTGVQAGCRRCPHARAAASGGAASCHLLAATLPGVACTVMHNRRDNNCAPGNAHTGRASFDILMIPYVHSLSQDAESLHHPEMSS